MEWNPNNYKVLVAITSCGRDAMNGNNDAIRKTYIPILQEMGIDYKFFIGIGEKPTDLEKIPSPEFNENYETQLQKLLIERPNDFYCVQLDRSYLKGDEILLDVDDTYAYHSYKVRESRKWAFDKDYDFIFKIDTDTYLDVWRLINSDFMNYDYWGNVVAGLNMDYAGGWRGYFLSKKAYSLTIKSPINYIAEDAWTASALKKYNILPTDWIQSFNDGITQMSTSPHGSFDIKFLEIAHSDCMRRAKDNGYYNKK